MKLREHKTTDCDKLSCRELRLKNYVMEKKTSIGFSDKSSVGSEKGI